MMSKGLLSRSSCAAVDPRVLRLQHSLEPLVPRQFMPIGGTRLGPGDREKCVPSTSLAGLPVWMTIGRSFRPPVATTFGSVISLMMVVHPRRASGQPAKMAKRRDLRVVVG
jgi:hypothetical protein